MTRKWALVALAVLGIATTVLADNFYRTADYGYITETHMFIRLDDADTTLATTYPTGWVRITSWDEDVYVLLKKTTSTTNLAALTDTLYWQAGSSWANYIRIDSLKIVAVDGSAVGSKITVEWTPHGDGSRKTP